MPTSPMLLGFRELLQQMRELRLPPRVEVYGLASGFSQPIQTSSEIHGRNWRNLHLRRR